MKHMDSNFICFAVTDFFHFYNWTVHLGHGIMHTIANWAKAPSIHWLLTVVQHSRVCWTLDTTVYTHITYVLGLVTHIQDYVRAIGCGTQMVYHVSVMECRSAHKDPYIYRHYTTTHLLLHGTPREYYRLSYYCVLSTQS